MAIVSENIERAIVQFKYEIRKSGIVSQLKLREIAKKSQRRKAKALIALRRKRQAIKRREKYLS